MHLARLLEKRRRPVLLRPLFLHLLLSGQPALFGGQQQTGRPKTPPGL